MLPGRCAYLSHTFNTSNLPSLARQFSVIALQSRQCYKNLAEARSWRTARTTFELIEQGSKLSSKAIEDELNEIRKNFTPSLGKDHGRVVLKSAKPLLERRITQLRDKLKVHQQTVAAELQTRLDESRGQIVDYYLPIVMSNPPDALLGQIWGN